MRASTSATAVETALVMAARLAAEKCRAPAGAPAPAPRPRSWRDVTGRRRREVVRLRSGPRHRDRCVPFSTDALWRSCSVIASDSSRSDRQAASPAARRHAGRHARFTAAAAALLLFGSVLAVASSPAGAANTASEARLDHDSNPATASVRQFGGSDRYATALAAARYFVDVANSTGSVETAVVASGESLVDAAAAAGLAGAKDAPVLLTRRARLSSAVAKFLDDAYISTVYVVGGENAVSAKVLADLRAVPSVESVIRLSGHDRQATSVAVSYEVGAESEYCSTGQTGAVLVNADVSFADVMAVGPLAFALELPLLLTAADTLPADVAGFLIDSEVERVVVVGGTSAVSSAVVDDLASVGVDDVTRIAGANRYATAVEVLTTLADCGSVSFSTTTVALVNADAPADGVSAAPLLGQGLGADGVTPMLLVTTGALPAATRAYLASTPLRVRDALDEAVFTQLSITSIGGTAVVTPTTMAAAVAAATTSSPLTAAVTAAVGASSFTITFSAAVPADACPSGGTATPTAGSVCNLAYYTVAGYPLNAGGDTVAYDPDKRTATIQLDDDVTDDASRTKLTAGDTVAIAGGKISAVDPTDKRVVAATVFTVEKVAVDRTRPRVSIVASENAYAFAVIVEDPNLPAFTATADPKF
ncbi:MAG TPA: hypothetical protein DEP66_03490, partial [Acidimicrobiaceae bacterium]|nr:hypothetical protein [Acidimicrobiaceae bacterium]